MLFVGVVFSVTAAAAVQPVVSVTIIDSAGLEAAPSYLVVSLSL